jgi:hypothetical protein
MQRIKAAILVAIAFVSLGAVSAPAQALGRWQNLPANASCMAFLAAASNPNASGEHIAALAQSGNAVAIAQANPSGTGLPGLFSCVERIP